jgi:hypothetical protein
MPLRHATDRDNCSWTTGKRPVGVTIGMFKAYSIRSAAY